ncbi:putative late blight resistance protein homolog R1A-10 [Salvia miltiorrhiza]|uniref:putative late blight resistance protein homolog R1A-10 n=1 Tax=Salvia miltiorrhiza TaxID=226208 RepID=UPI0025AC8161|nr:putative late blight resistance protein homolog R1A-10 [Salvia miltiorrhiza]XP_057812480.1 putative late blight resistance protein homolog R1A-10 [Salvia miltiorrhiza]
MAAYGAAASLKNTIQRILQSSRISLVSHSPQILQPAYDEMDRLQKVLLKLDETSCSKIRTKVNAADERIKEAVWEFEDLLESHILHQILPQLESERDNLSFYVDLRNLQYHVDCFVMTVKMMKVEYTKEKKNMAEEEGEPISSRIDFGGIKSKMVGRSYAFQNVRDGLLEGKDDSIIGMAGVGKTTLAKHIFEDPSIRSHFDFRAWVKVGRKCEPNELLRCVLAQVDANAYRMLAQGDDDGEELVGLLKEKLQGKKCLIVLDDVWETQAISRMINCLKEGNIRGGIGYLLTSRQQITLPQLTGIRLSLLNEEDSKKLLGEKVFGEKVFSEDGFPPQLEELGEKIAEKCEGLPLMIVTIAELLSKANKTPEYWTEVAYKQQNSLFEDAYNQISEVLFPSYDYLPQHLKMFFLYMGAFRPYIDQCPFAISFLLSAEGFLELNVEKSFEGFLEKLSTLYHLVLDTKSSWYLERQYRVHSCWQHLCKVEASRIKFLHVLRGCDDVIKDQRRLCAHWNSLFCFKQVYDLIKSDCASTVRSLLCCGYYHAYPIPIHAMGFKLLRVLTASRVRFYHIPTEILKLVCLRYLALTCNGELPPSISNLFHLQFLIIHPHMFIRKRGVQSYMPVQIWDMQELQHIQIWGMDLPTPNTDDATLNKLTSLRGVSANSCTREVLKRIPNLKALWIKVELKPYDDDDDERNPLSCLGYISQLQNLELLEYWVNNPEIKNECNTIPLSMFPSSLKMLRLHGLGGYPWNYLNDIGSLLPNLEILKLSYYAFRGPEWDITPGSFLKLIELQILDTNLVRWRPQRGSFPMLRRLSMQHCYKLQQLDWPYDHSWIEVIELVECNPLAVACVNQLKDKFSFRLLVKSSF